MAKVGFYLRGARGKLAGATLYRTAGGTIAREINTSPKVSLTVDSTSQRARFKAAALLFKVFTKALENKAFEAKTGTQSDYNIFIKENVSKVLPYPKELADAYLYPAPMAVGAILSRGSLRSPEYPDPEEGDQYASYVGVKLPSLAEGADYTTFGQLCQALCDKYLLNNGDIVTFAAATLLTVRESPTAAPHKVPAFEDVAKIKQFIIDTTSTAPIEDGVIDDELGIIDGVLGFSPSYQGVGGVYFSRRTPAGLLVSTTPLLYTQGAHDVISQMIGSDVNSYIYDTALSWGAIDNVAVLEGALVQQ